MESKEDQMTTGDETWVVSTPQFIDAILECCGPEIHVGNQCYPNKFNFKERMKASGYWCTVND